MAHFFGTDEFGRDLSARVVHGSRYSLLIGLVTSLMALILNPEFVVCDEPVSALDVSIQAQMLNLLMDLQEQMGLTYLFITHDLSVVRHISDEILVMYLGKCVERADTKEIFRNPVHSYTKALLASIPIPSVESCHKRRELIQGEVTNPVNPKPGAVQLNHPLMNRAKFVPVKQPAPEESGKKRNAY